MACGHGDVGGGRRDGGFPVRNPAKASFEEHRRYLHDIVRLKLFFVHLWLERHPGESFRFVMRQRVDIYRKTDANPGLLTPTRLYFDAPEWTSMEDEAFRIYRRTAGDRAAFEEEAFRDVFLPSIDARAMRDYLDPSPLHAYQCGSLKHDPAPADGGRTLDFHIGNAVCPRSIFDDPGYMPRCFAALLDKAEAMGATRIRTDTWLNGHRKWLALFPPEWSAENLSAPDKDVRWHYGFWGQFISARHTFNAKYGRFLRETGELPFYPRSSWCSVKRMREKIAPFLDADDGRRRENAPAGDGA